jgi:nitroreductase
LQYILIEVGHAAQNILLQATSLDLGSVVIGAFEENKIKQIIELDEDEVPLYIIPIGKLAHSN